MAITLAGLRGITPVSAGGGHGKSPATPLRIQVGPTQTVRVGDILVGVAATGKVIVNNAPNAAALATLVGVAMTAATTGASPTDRDTVIYCPALPNQVFEATIANDTGNADITGFDYVNYMYESFQISATNTGGIPIIDVGAANIAGAFIVGIATGQNRGLNFSSTTTVNPRVYFMFQDSVFLTPPATTI